MQTEDFDAYLPQPVRRRLHRSKQYQTYAARREALSECVLLHWQTAGGTKESALLSDVRALESMGRALIPLIERLMEEERMRD